MIMKRDFWGFMTQLTDFERTQKTYRKMYWVYKGIENKVYAMRFLIGFAENDLIKMKIIKAVSYFETWVTPFVEKELEFQDLKWIINEEPPEIMGEKNINMLKHCIDSIKNDWGLSFHKILNMDDIAPQIKDYLMQFKELVDDIWM